jgi:hypothetical protein
VGSGSSPARAPRIRSAQRARSGYGALPSACGVAAKGTSCYPAGPGRNARTWSSRGWARASTRRVRFAPRVPAKCRRGHRSVKTTMIYTHVLNRGGHGVQSPLDLL